MHTATEHLAFSFMALGLLLLIGFLTDVLGQRTHLPRVTLLLVFGIIAGPAVLGWVPDFSQAWFPFVANIALVMVGFLLGEKLTVRKLRQNGRLVLSISVAAVLVTALIIFVGLLLVGAKPELAILLAAVGTATAPAATTDVVQELRAQGKFTDTLLGVVAVDDVWGLILFSLALVLAQVMLFDAFNVELLWRSAWEIFGALGLGIALGVPMAFLTGRIRRGEPMLLEALVFVFLCAGLALWLHVSYLLAAVTMGAMVANFARHHTRPFHMIENVERPFLILFFVLAGASLHLESLTTVGAIGLAYILLRMAGRIAGAWVGCRIGVQGRAWGRDMGLALMPQAGVAMAMALAVTQVLPELSQVILPVVIASTVVFELIGPLMTRYALTRVQETGAHVHRRRQESKG